MFTAEQARTAASEQIATRREVGKEAIEGAIRRAAGQGIRIIGSGDFNHDRLSTEAKRELDDAGFEMEFHGPTNWTIRW